MTVFALPEGVEVDLKIYLTGIVEGVATDMVIRLGGMPSFSDSCTEPVDVETLVKTRELDGLGHGWRVMTREEIADYKRRDAEEIDEG